MNPALFIPNPGNEVLIHAPIGKLSRPKTSRAAASWSFETWRGEVVSRSKLSRSVHVADAPALELSIHSELGELARSAESNESSAAGSDRLCTSETELLDWRSGLVPVLNAWEHGTMRECNDNQSA